MKIIKKGILFAVIICVIWSQSAAASSQPESQAAGTSYTVLAPTKEQKKINKNIVDLLRNRHYLKIVINDQMSSKILYRYLDELDPSHSYFYDKDIKEFESKYRFALDDALNRGELEPAFEIFNIYQQRVLARLAYLIDSIENGLGEMNFDVEEIMQIERKDMDWPSSEAAMEELWRKRLKSNVLSLKLADKSLDEIQEILLKRYRNQLNRIQQNSSDDAFEFYINSLALSTDPHTQYFSPHRTENFNINMSLSLEGIGAVLQSEDEYTKVLRLIPGGPAERSKLLKAADRIVGVAQGSDGEMLDIVGWRLDEVVNKIRGPKGTLVRLEIIPADEADSHQTKVISIVRDKVKLEEQAAQKQIIEIKRDAKVHKIGIIDIPTFYADFKGMNEGNPDYKSTTKDVQKLLLELKEEGVEGIIIDLRDNGGGSLQEANSLTGLFIGLGPTVQVRNANGRIDIIRDHDPQLVYSGPLVVLVNRMSASASEIFAGAIQDYSRGIVIGEETFGKGTVQSLMPLSKGQLKATTAKYYRISGKSTQHKGVVPDLYYPSLYSFDDIGESALPEALPWDMINSIPYQTYYKFEEVMPWLENLHNARNSLSQDYQYVLDRRKRNEMMSNKKAISLSEKTRREERVEADKWRLELENALRVGKGEPPLEKISDLKEDGARDSHNAKVDVKDPEVIEAGETLVDFIEFLDKRAASR
ncbi:MAG: peptidase S41 [Desulfobacterales bacterium SG8_35]|nr:MAG: peptidase S41 [Desulfobacterales bacterium SG8_35]